MGTGTTTSQRATRVTVVTLEWTVLTRNSFLGTSMISTAWPEPVPLQTT